MGSVMSPKQTPRKPDQYKRGGIYLCDLPKQPVTETTDGIVHHRDGVERHGWSPCVVISTSDYNDSQANGLIVVPIISGVSVDLAKFKKVPPTWVRLLAQGEPGFAVVDQVRYSDRSRCNSKIGQLLDFDLKLAARPKPRGVAISPQRVLPRQLNCQEIDLCQRLGHLLASKPYLASVILESVVKTHRKFDFPLI
jgi:mRNA-degrading endonuclease toxin of MazEF toxin-antitoxin module